MPANSFSAYPGRFNNGVTIGGMPVLSTHAGNIWWVDSGIGSDSGGADGTITRPFATIDYALGRCTASNGDIIMLAPGHSEAISTADIDIDVAGVSIVAAPGANGTLMPTITFTGTTDTTCMDITAANVVIAGIRFLFDDNDAVDTAIKINGARCEIAGCVFEAGANDQPDTFITVGVADADANNAYIHDCVFRTITAGANSAILLAKDHTFVRIEDNYIDGDFADGGISAPAAGDACLEISIRRNYSRNRQTGDHAIELTGTTITGVIADNRLVTDTQTAALDAAACSCMGNLWSDGAGGDTEGVPVNPIADAANNFIGVDDADNVVATTNVAANRDGSVLERLEHIAQNQVDDVAGNALGFDDANNVFSSANVTANQDGSLLEREEQLQQLAAMAGFYNSGNYFAVTADLTSATWNTVASHEIATVTGAVRMLILPQCTSTVVTVGTNGTFVLGNETTADALIASSLLDALATGEWWVDATITRTLVTRTQMNALEFVIGNGKDIGYTIGTNAATNGTIVFHCWWVPIDATGAVAAGAGGSL